VDNIRDVVCRNYNRLVEASPLSQREIAKRVGVDPSTLQRWRTGDSFPELPNIEKLALVLGVNALEFYNTDERLMHTQSQPVSTIFKKIMAIPDEVYEEASKIPRSHERSKVAWGQVMVILKKAQREIEEEEKAKRG
jgi:transcriptional regulator with XRE-family HTH domain